MEVFVIGHGNCRGWTDLAAHEDCIFASGFCDSDGRDARVLGGILIL